MNTSTYPPRPLPVPPGGAEVDDVMPSPRHLPRTLHPGAWWCWTLGLAAAASFTLNPIILLMICAVAAFVVMARRTSAPWALSFRYYVYFALFIVALRIGFRILLGGSSVGDDRVLLNLPSIPLPSAAQGIDLLGPFTVTEFVSSLYEGIRLGTMVICIGAANMLANPRRLLKSVPPALYEVGTAIVVALAIFPQLAESVQRVHRARTLRGEPGKGVSYLRRIVVPVLEDALERSMTLAAGMDARGYGRAGESTPRQRLASGTFMLLALFGIMVGTYGFLVRSTPRWLATPMMVLGLVAAVVSFWSAGRGVERSRYRPDTWRMPEFITVASGLAVGVGIHQYAHLAGRLGIDVWVMVPPYDDWPSMTLVALLVPLFGLIPAFATPLPVDDTDDADFNDEVQEGERR